MNTIIKISLISAALFVAISGATFFSTTAFAWDADFGGGCCGGGDSYSPSFGGDGYGQGSYGYGQGSYTVPAECKFLNADKTTVPASGGDVTLSWETKDATKVSISSGVGDVSANGSKTVNVTSEKTFILTAEGTGGNDACQVTITLEAVSDFSCDFFNIDKSLVKKGEDFTLSWGTTNADSVTIDQGIGSVSDDGTYTTSTTEDRTYTLTVEKDGDTKTCSDSVQIETDSYSQGSYYSEGSYGGGGSSNPRCELEASAEEINAGKEIKLTWETTRATDVVIEDDRGNVLLDTNDLSSSDKKDFLDGEMTVRPVRDTTYTLIAERGSKDKECEVEIEVKDKVVVYESRDQMPLVAGIYLTQVPYTGFEAGPTLTFLFYALLTIWALFIAYVLVIRRDSIMGFSLAGTFGHAPYREASVVDQTPEHISEAEDYVQSTIVADVPSNLPTAAASTAIAYTAQSDVDTEEDSLTALENRAHQKQVLLSSDAMRYFAGVVAADEQMNTLDEVIKNAKGTFPSEDGWVVLNLSRMESLLVDDSGVIVEDVLAQAPAASMVAGSLAEAIVTGNIVAAYQMIASRPMIALADAAADLDAVYRSRKGEEVTISDMLATSVTDLSVEQLEAAIKALTSALDGTYTDEASAVKMAIMKAVKAVS